jgi:hypothetical protein
MFYSSADLIVSSLFLKNGPSIGLLTTESAKSLLAWQNFAVSIAAAVILTA